VRRRREGQSPKVAKGDCVRASISPWRHWVESQTWYKIAEWVKIATP